MRTALVKQFRELGNGDNFIFDIGEGSVANYLASGVAFNELNDIFLTHLHVDHYNALPYVYMFGAWGGRWHEPLRVYGPSGRTEKDGINYLIEGMKMMTHWHREAFSVFPIGKGWDVEVTEFDFMDDGGVVYDKNGVKVIHWRQSHAKDGASAYRLDWNGLEHGLLRRWTPELVNGEVRRRRGRAHHGTPDRSRCHQFGCPGRFAIPGALHH